MTCARCADLEERLAFLESERRVELDGETYARLVAAFPTLKRCHGRPQAVEMLLALYAAKGRTLSHAVLLERVPAKFAREEDRDPGIVKLWAHVARKAVGAEAIASVPGRGYCLTSEGLARVAEIIGAQA